MKVLIIVGSRRDGNCLKLSQKLKERLKKERIISNIIVPGNQKIYLCTGCMDCDENGVCDFKDDMEDNIKKILDSECLIFITPTRWNLLSGDLKIFMDRLNPLYVPKKLKDKKSILIAIGGSSEEEFSTNGAINSLDSFCERSECIVLDRININNCLLADDINLKDDINIVIDNICKLIKS